MISLRCDVRLRPDVGDGRDNTLNLTGGSVGLSSTKRWGRDNKSDGPYISQRFIGWYEWR
jgi:hypothetical protein